MDAPCLGEIARRTAGVRETKARLVRILSRSQTRHTAVRPGWYLVKRTKFFGDMSMLGSPNLYRGNAPLAMRLKIDDLRAQLAPLDRYGVGGMSFAMTGGLRALVSGFKSALRGAFSCTSGGPDCEAV
jgi:hypothetical protein